MQWNYVSKGVNFCFAICIQSILSNWEMNYEKVFPSDISPLFRRSLHISLKACCHQHLDTFILLILRWICSTSRLLSSKWWLVTLETVYRISSFTKITDIQRKACDGRDVIVIAGKSLLIAYSGVHLKIHSTQSSLHGLLLLRDPQFWFPPHYYYPSHIFKKKAQITRIWRPAEFMTVSWTSLFMSLS